MAKKCSQERDLLRNALELITREHKRAEAASHRTDGEKRAVVQAWAYLMRQYTDELTEANFERGGEWNPNSV